MSGVDKNYCPLGATATLLWSSCLSDDSDLIWSDLIWREARGINCQPSLAVRIGPGMGKTPLKFRAPLRDARVMITRLTSA